MIRPAEELEIVRDSESEGGGLSIVFDASLPLDLIGEVLEDGLEDLSERLLLLFRGVVFDD